MSIHLHKNFLSPTKACNKFPMKITSNSPSSHALLSSSTLKWLQFNQKRWPPPYIQRFLIFPNNKPYGRQGRLACYEGLIIHRLLKTYQRSDHMQQSGWRREKKRFQSDSHICLLYYTNTKHTSQRNLIWRIHARLERPKEEKRKENSSHKSAICSFRMETF